MPTRTRDTVTDWPLWWFARLDAALDRGDQRAISTAVRKLEQLGIEVRFLLPPGYQSRDACRKATELAQRPKRFPAPRRGDACDGQ
jgi:hypothetical protein